MAQARDLGKDGSASTSVSSEPIERSVPSTSNPVTAESGNGDGSLFSGLFNGNPYFSAGFGLMLFGAALAASRRGITTAATQAQRRLLVSLEIPSKDKAHPWFLSWMGAQAKAQAMREAGLLPYQKESIGEFLGIRSKRQQHTEAEGSPSNTTGVDDPLRTGNHRASPIRIYSHELSVETMQANLKKPNSSAIIQHQPQQFEAGGQRDTSRDARFAFVPGPGTHWFRYKGCWMRFTRERNGRMIDLTTGAPWETITLTTLRSHQHLFTELLAEARQLALTSSEGKTTIYTVWGTEWRPFGLPRRARDLQSVVLARGKRDRIEQDVRRFMQRGWWYAERGIPYRRGYLLHGSPGSGKSSFIFALAGSLDLSICLLNLSERGLTDDKLNFLLSNAPERSILLLEDVDSAFLGRQRAAESDGYQANVTFSGLLNSLDGVASSESRIIFMTTNHVERLDPALIRPGRVDYIEELGDAEPDQVEDLFMRFYGPRQLRIQSSVSEDPTSALANDENPKLKEDQLRPLAQRLGQLVQTESIRRRRALGLDDEGRFANTAEENSLSFSTLAKKESDLLKASRAMRLQPAARGGVSMAELQGLFIQHPDDGQAAINTFEEMMQLSNP
ncbi:hypothetical protein L7F22_003181 [Adiantum nelumboides]|nr:hypothetical protein [Adiantum nelumboides]